MTTFKIYPRHNATPFKMACHRFEARKDCFVLFDSGSSEESSQGFLSFSEVAAIVPDETSKSSDTPIEFLIYLANQTAPIKVFAGSFELQKETGRVVFFTETLDVMRRKKNKGQPIVEIYLATSNLVAIIPSDGLISLDAK